MLLRCVADVADVFSRRLVTSVAIDSRSLEISVFSTSTCMYK